MKKLLAALAAAMALSALVGCGALIEKDGNFVVYNVSDRVVHAIVNDGAEHPVGKQNHSAFTEKVPIPANPVSSYGVTGPSATDKVAQVSVSFRVEEGNGKSHILSPIFCTAGAKVITTIWYDVSYGYESARCQVSY